MTIARIVALALDGRITVEIGGMCHIDDFALGELIEIGAHIEPTVELPPATDEGDWLDT